MNKAEHATREGLAKDLLAGGFHHTFPLPKSWGVRKRRAQERRLEELRTMICARAAEHLTLRAKRKKSPHSGPQLDADQYTLDLAEALISMNAHETAELQLDKIK